MRKQSQLWVLFLHPGRPIKINRSRDNYSFCFNCFSIKRSFVFKTSNAKLRFFNSSFNRLTKVHSISQILVQIMTEQMKEIKSLLTPDHYWLEKFLPLFHISSWRYFTMTWICFGSWTAFTYHFGAIWQNFLEIILRRCLASLTFKMFYEPVAQAFVASCNLDKVTISHLVVFNITQMSTRFEEWIEFSF